MTVWDSGLREESLKQTAEVILAWRMANVFSEYGGEDQRTYSKAASRRPARSLKTSRDLDNKRVQVSARDGPSFISSAGSSKRDGVGTLM